MSLPLTESEKLDEIRNAEEELFSAVGLRDRLKTECACIQMRVEALRGKVTRLRLESLQQTAPVSDGWTAQADEDAADQEYCDRVAVRP